VILRYFIVHSLLLIQFIRTNFLSLKVLRQISVFFIVFFHIILLQSVFSIKKGYLSSWQHPHVFKCPYISVIRYFLFQLCWDKPLSQQSHKASGWLTHKIVSGGHGSGESYSFPCCIKWVCSELPRDFLEWFFLSPVSKLKIH
jgi:hypothetical protein